MHFAHHIFEPYACGPVSTRACVCKNSHVLHLSTNTCFASYPSSTISLSPPQHSILVLLLQVLLYLEKHSFLAMIQVFTPSESVRNALRLFLESYRVFEDLSLTIWSFWRACWYRVDFLKIFRLQSRASKGPIDGVYQRMHLATLSLFDNFDSLCCFLRQPLHFCLRLLSLRFLLLQKTSSPPPPPKEKKLENQQPQGQRTPGNLQQAFLYTEEVIDKLQ